MANTLNLQQLQEQVRTMQQQQRFTSVCALMLLLLVGLAVMTGQGQSGDRGNAIKEVHAGRFVLVDADGNERAVLGMTPDGGARLSVSDRDKTVAAWVGVDGAGSPSLAIVNSEGKAYANLKLVHQLPQLILARHPGKPRVGLAVAKDGTARIDVLDANGKTRSSIQASPNDESSGLRVYDTHGKLRATLEIGCDGAPLMTLWDPKQRNRLTVETAKDGSGPAISFFGPHASHHRVSLALENDDRPVLSFVDKGKKMRLALGLTQDGSPLIVQRDKDGKQSWTAP